MIYEYLSHFLPFFAFFLHLPQNRPEMAQSFLFSFPSYFTASISYSFRCLLFLPESIFIPMKIKKSPGWQTCRPGIKTGK